MSGIAIETDRVRVTDQVYPMPSPTLAEMRRCQQLIDQPLVRTRGCVREKGIDVRRRGRKADQVQVRAADKRHAIRIGRKRQTLFFEPRQNELIDRRTGPLDVSGLWWSRPGQFAECPVLLRIILSEHPLRTNQTDRDSDQQAREQYEPQSRRHLVTHAGWSKQSEHGKPPFPSSLRHLLHRTRNVSGLTSQSSRIQVAVFLHDPRCREDKA